jgi:glycosyl transferase family 25
MPHQIWQAYDGTGDTIVAPEHLANDSFMRMLKVTDHYMTRGEVACALSHISLWSHCVQIDRPIVILEHDAVMLKKFQQHGTFNSVVYLGGAEWYEKNWPMVSIPPHASDGPNKHFICRAHAYSIDPTVAKNMLAHVLKMGICDPLDIMMRTDLFNITHQGMYAYDKPMGNTTIASRPTDGRTVKRNDDLAV